MFDSQNDIRRIKYPECVKPENLPKKKLTVRHLYRRQNGCCFYCRTELDPITWRLSDPRGYTRDHFFPVAAGNDELVGNMVLSCKKCNEEKKHYPPTEKEIKRFCALYNWDHIFLKQCFGKGSCL